VSERTWTEIEWTCINPRKRKAQELNREKDAPKGPSYPELRAAVTFHAEKMRIKMFTKNRITGNVLVGDCT
jgi:hypothetical protein